MISVKQQIEEALERCIRTGYTPVSITLGEFDAKELAYELKFPEVLTGARYKDVPVRVKKQLFGVMVEAT